MMAEAVRVLYDYDYDTADGRHIKINRGDIFILLAKSNEEWWKVRRGEREKFYVPANYVAVVEKKDSPPTRPRQPSINGSITLTTDIPTTPRTHKRTLSAGVNSINTVSTDSSNPSSNHSRSNSTASLERNSSQPNGNVTITGIWQSDTNLEVSTSNLSINEDRIEEPPDYANMAIIQEIIAQRKENAEAASSLSGRSSGSHNETWEMHTDDETGRVYYYNNLTKETTWESPVIKRNSHDAPDITSTNGTHSTSSINGLSDSSETNTSNDSPQINGAQSLAPKKPGRVKRVQSLRRGWTEAVHQDGQASYVHNATGEKWLTAVDHSGRSYYYKEDGKESLWELPEHSGGMGLNVKNQAATPSVEKRGYLNKSKINDGRKKVKKQWARSFVVAYDNSLLIYKDEKAAIGIDGAEFGSPEAIIDLQHATLDWAGKDLSTRKNVVQLTCASGTCYLLQHEDNMLMIQWYNILISKIKQFSPDLLNSPQIIEESVRPEPEPNNNDLKRRKHSRRVTKQMQTKTKSSTNGGGKFVYTVFEEDKAFTLPPSQGPVGEVVKLSIRDRLRNFLTRRPTQESLEKQGILQAERVFGSRLQFICDREGTTVPKFVQKCIAQIEEKGLEFDGLYRINGNQAQIQKLRFIVDSCDDYSLKDCDINVLTGSLKLFFRELKEPLIPFDLYPQLSEIIREKDKGKKARLMKLKLATMSTVNLATLKMLFAHLVRVHEHEAKNRMKRQNIAIVFGPTLMWPERESSAIAINMMCQNSIVEYILRNFHTLF